MNRYAITLAAALLILGSAASAQLSARERDCAQERARIQARADAEERAKERQTQRDMAQSACRSSNRLWDYANGTCKPR